MFRHDGVEDPLLFYVNVSEALFIATLAIVFLAARGAAHAAWRRASVAAVLSAGLGLAAAKVISELVDRSRPFVADPHGVHLFSAHAPDPGFPSDHATAAFAIAVAIVLRKRGGGLAGLAPAPLLSHCRLARGGPFPGGVLAGAGPRALGAVTVLSIGRVALGVHFPSDVLAGAALGSLVAIALWSRPLRNRIDALADFLGRPCDGVLERAGHLLRLALLRKP